MAAQGAYVANGMCIKRPTLHSKNWSFILPCSLELCENTRIAGIHYFHTIGQVRGLYPDPLLISFENLPLHSLPAKPDACILETSEIIECKRNKRKVERLVDTKEDTPSSKAKERPMKKIKFFKKSN